MILIADSGSSKTDWLLPEALHEPKKFRTIGLNPYHIDSASIEQVLRKELLPFLDEELITKVYFYGAGCSGIYKSFIVEDALEALFSNAEINIESDLLGASRALFGHHKGIACILGTGSNSCYYDGKKVARNLPSLGYFFGDEGSGTHMGKTFIKAYLLNKVPEDLRKSFDERYHYTKENILDAIYNLPMPNRFLASFGDFFADHINDDFVNKMITDCFTEFFENHVIKYEEAQKLPVSFLGSVAYYFQEQLLKVAENHNIEIREIKQTALEGLEKYHDE